LGVPIGSTYHRATLWRLVMQAWLCENPVGVDALQWTELPDPLPQAGEVLVDIRAASLNFPDILIVQNKYQFKPQPPFVPGAEFAGVVTALGPGVSHLRVGQAVACVSGTGALRATRWSMQRCACRCPTTCRGVTRRHCS